MEITLQDLDFENEKWEELQAKIKSNVDMIKNYAKQIKPVLEEYREAYSLDFEEDIINLLCDEIIKTL